MPRRDAPPSRPAGRGGETEPLATLLTGAEQAEAEAEAEAETSPTKRKLLAAAVEVFAELGYRGATTRVLARRAGVAEKTLFAHYGTKAALFAAAMGPGLEALMGSQIFAELAEELMRAGSAEERLLAVARNRLRFAANNVELVKAIFQEVLLNPGFRDRLIAYWAKNLLPAARAAISHGIHSGTLREVDPNRVIRMFVSLMIGYVMTRHVLLPELAWDDEAELEVMMGTLTRGLSPDPA